MPPWSKSCSKDNHTLNFVFWMSNLGFYWYTVECLLIWHICAWHLYLLWLVDAHNTLCVYLEVHMITVPHIWCPGRIEVNEHNISSVFWILVRVSHLKKCAQKSIWNLLRLEQEVRWGKADDCVTLLWWKRWKFCYQRHSQSSDFQSIAD